MHPRDKTHIKTGIKHEMWVWKAIFYAVSNQIAYLFSNKWFRLQTSVSVHGKGKTTFQSKVFSSSCLFLILRRIVEGLVLGKTQSCWAERQVGKQTFGSSTQLSKYICPDRISFNFMEALLTLVLLAWWVRGSRAEPAPIRQEKTLISDFTRDP